VAIVDNPTWDPAATNCGWLMTHEPIQPDAGAETGTTDTALDTYYSNGCGCSTTGEYSAWFGTMLAAFALCRCR
jgi:hypothetical protein